MQSKPCRAYKTILSCCHILCILVLNLLFGIIWQRF